MAMKRPKQPPLGARPRFIFEEQRILELEGAIMRFVNSHWPIPMEFIEEYNELVGKLEQE